jgi:hypothetical protein
MSTVELSGHKHVHSSAVQPITGDDLRPLWRIAGRLTSACYVTFSDVAFDVTVTAKDGSVLDSGELLLKGTVAPMATRGFEQQIHLRIDKPGWTWTMSPSRAQVVP